MFQTQKNLSNQIKIQFHTILYLMQRQIPLVGLLLVAALTSFALFNLKVDSKPRLSERVAFEEWKISFAKSYGSDAQHKYRFDIFCENLLMINEHNLKYEKGEVFSFMRLNQFSDLTQDEFRTTYLSEHVHTGDFTCTGPKYKNQSSFNETFSTDKNMLTAVGQQGQCTAGYAFATVGAVEASMYKTIKQTVAMSAQQLIDCSKETGNNGCSGGTPLGALNELINRGAMKAVDYQYTGRTDDCKYTAAKKIWEVEGCTKADGDIALLKSQILEQPVIVGFDASDTTFQGYGGGLYKPNKCTSKINHYMLAVGWGQETTGVAPFKSENYYIVVKNSFGAKWGESGYVKVVVQIDKKETGACGMLTYVFFPFG